MLRLPFTFNLTFIDILLDALLLRHEVRQIKTSNEKALSVF